MISRNRVAKTLANWISNYETSNAKLEGKTLNEFIISMVDITMCQAEEDWFRLVRIRKEYADKQKEETGEPIPPHRNALYDFVKGISEDDIIMLKIPEIQKARDHMNKKKSGGGHKKHSFHKKPAFNSPSYNQRGYTSGDPTDPRYRNYPKPTYQKRPETPAPTNSESNAPKKKVIIIHKKKPTENTGE